MATEINRNMLCQLKILLLTHKFNFPMLTLSKGVVIKKGWFQNTHPEVKESIGKISIFRLDGDWYDSTKYCLDGLFNNVVPGGYIILDDYGAWESCRKATD